MCFLRAQLSSTRRWCIERSFAPNGLAPHVLPPRGLAPIAVEVEPTGVFESPVAKTYLLNPVLPKRIVHHHRHDRGHATTTTTSDDEGDDDDDDDDDDD